MLSTSKHRGPILNFLKKNCFVWYCGSLPIFPRDGLNYDLYYAFYIPCLQYWLNMTFCAVCGPCSHLYFNVAIDRVKISELKGIVLANCTTYKTTHKIKCPYFFYKINVQFNNGLAAFSYHILKNTATYMHKVT